MTIRYTYNCPSCGVDYLEQRAVDQPQVYSKCSRCDVEFNLISETPAE
jgi:DNA-directed RNA polymerase subunit RPC12/RpoP